jgi:hypothetical protein
LRPNRQKPSQQILTLNHQKLEVKPLETIAVGFESKPSETIAAGFDAKPLETVTTGFEV